MPLLATGEAYVRVSFLPGTLQIPIEAILTQRTGLLSFAKLLAPVSTAFATAFARLMAALRPVAFTTVAAVGLGFGLVEVLSLRRRVVTGLSMLGILLQMLFRFDLAELHLDCCCRADHPG